MPATLVKRSGYGLQLVKIAEDMNNDIKVISDLILFSNSPSLRLIYYNLRSTKWNIQAISFKDI